ncbi:sulfotransferase domain-containing protein [Alteromonas halophila]|uniref:Sulfotransferase domain-containing protein n=1 Tax=Alteromonas halophila TaxID=516698 RepID=A0A918JIV4_9ALTE|nr:sulfotransferase domain-containing protein [Alteromonas halophila]GGW82289.1 hypothetical protein GCM10007391_14150 [Alteromonas halophila]
MSKLAMPQGKVVVNACFPRSGHRFLRQLLNKVYGQSFNSDTYHPRKGKEGVGEEHLQRANYIKSHDFELAGTAMLEQLHGGKREFLVQLRHPLMAISSYYEFALKHNHVARNSQRSWDDFLVSRLEYWKQFASTWWLNKALPESQYCLVNYESLTHNTTSELERVVSFISGEESVAEINLAKVTDSAPFLQYNNDTQSKKASVRTPEQFQYFDHATFAEIENKLARDYLVPLGIPLLFEE